MRITLALAGQLLGYGLEIVVLCSLGFILIKKLAPARTIYKVKFGKGQREHEIHHTLRMIVLDSSLALAMVESGLVRFSSTSIATVLLVFAAHFVFFEIWFYFTHVLRHQKWLYRFHAVHHRSRVCTPITNFSASIVDRLISSIGFWIPLVFFSRLDLLSPIAVALILIVSNVGGVLIHSNVECFWHLDRNVVVQALTHSVSSHALHHARVRGNYGQFTSFLDKLFGTYIADTPALTAQALRGRPLTALQERAVDTSDVRDNSEATDIRIPALLARPEGSDIRT